MLPIASLPLVWWLALTGWRQAGADPGERRWARGLLALAVLDTMFAGAVVALAVWFASGAAIDFSQVPPPPRTRIGVRVAEDPAGPSGARITAVLAGSPAHRAGLRAGDVIVGVDGADVDGFADAAASLAGGPEGAPRMLSIARGEGRLDVTVTPDRPGASAGLFRSWMGDTCPDLATVTRRVLRTPGFWVAAPLVLVLPVALRGLRGPGPPLWRWVALAVAGGVAASTAVSHAICVALGGPVAGGAIVAGGVQTSVILAVATIAHRRLRRDLPTARLTPALDPVAAIGLGVFYLLALIPRVQVVLLALVQMTARDIGGRTVIGEAAQALSGWDARLLLVLIVVAMAPVGEELLFRGVVLPRLYPRLGAAGSVVATSVLFASLHFDYGARMLTIFVLSAVLGWARLATGGLAAPIALHALTNAVGILFILRS